jgi:hypothetical protein
MITQACVVRDPLGDHKPHPHRSRFAAVSKRSYNNYEGTLDRRSDRSCAAEYSSLRQRIGHKSVLGAGRTSWQRRVTTSLGSLRLLGVRWSLVNGIAGLRASARAPRMPT